MNEELVRIENLVKTFPGVLALSNARFDLVAGEVHALMGENGAGKSTMMKILAGIYTKDSGSIHHLGKPVEIPDPRTAQHLGISMVHQELNLMNHLSAAQNIFIGREPRKGLGLLLDEKLLNEQAGEYFTLLNLDLDPRTRIGELTVAKQQMVEIAKALSFKSRVLIMDEPTAALNNTEIDELFRIIRGLKAQGVGIVYISHKMDELKQISDRVTVMRDGHYVGTVPTAETSMDTIISMMVGRTLFECWMCATSNAVGPSGMSASRLAGARSWVLQGSWAPAEPKSRVPCSVPTPSIQGKSGSRGSGPISAIPSMQWPPASATCPRIASAMASPWGWMSPRTPC
jgi:ABC-type sugar transport system ATPase subunit